ncbi:peptide chain release factor 2 [Candidatus Hydrogenedentota bacterium]
MYDEEKAVLEDIKKRLARLKKGLGEDGLRAEISELEEEMSKAGFWNDQETAQANVKKLKRAKAAVEPLTSLCGALEDSLVLLELGVEEEDESLAEEITEAISSLKRNLDGVELRSLLSGDNDERSAIVSIHPGAGGTESCDWADMLFRMYTRYLETHDYKYEVLDYLPGDEAGVKSVTLSVEGDYPYGYLKAENGVHRLVRISPFDANSRRHTSFAAVEVIPGMDDEIEIDIDEKDLRIDTYRASGAGGQHVNKTDSAIRITHTPTNTVVQCQSQRSQHKNKAQAMRLLAAKLEAIEREKREAELAAGRANQDAVAWGSQIRSYVLQPYQMIKDHRTNVEVGNVQSVLDGDLDKFIEAYLNWQLEAKR